MTLTLERETSPDTRPIGDALRPVRILHLSDPHFGAHAATVAEDLVRLANALRPHALVISGDLTQRATRLQFAQAADWLRRLPSGPRLLLPGNHDIPLFNVWQRLFDPYGRYTRFLRGQREPKLRLPQVLVVGVDTTRWWRHQHGAVSEQQIDTTARVLRAEPEHHWRIVVTHHPLIVRDERDHRDRPWGHEAALQSWQAAGADLLLSGHLHVPALLPVGPLLWQAQAGSSISTRLPRGQANSVQLLTQKWVGDQCVRTIDRWDHDASARGGFLRATHSELRAQFRATA